MSKLPEYQYHLKDHLGNVRLTFSAEPVTESNTATLETVHEEEEYANFLRYAETTKINTTFFDHTGNGDTHYAIRLNGSEHERIGLAKSLSVMTGDTVRAEAYAKYLDPDENNWTAALQDLMAAIAGGTAPTGTVIEAVPPGGGDGFPFAGLLDAAKAGDTGTRAYLNILLFDEGLGFLDAAYVPVSTAAREDGTGVPHEKLSGEIVVQQPGYAYIYLSNDNGQPLEVFFDDFTVIHAHSAIVQVDDYYPFGLTFNSYKRENSIGNKFLYNQGTGDKQFKTERIIDLGLNLDMTKLRMYDYALGRFTSVDPLADVNPQESWSPYQYVYNNPIRYSDPYGDCVPCLRYLNQAVDFSSGFANALASNNVMGAGRQSGGSSSFRSGQTAGDVAGVIQGAVETVAGAITVAGGGAVTLVTVGAASPVTVPATVAGTAVAAHGLTVVGTAVDNLLKSEGQGNQGSGQGRGKNRRQPDPEATGDHTVINDRGSSTFQKNSNNPNGWQETSHIDTQGAAHTNKQTGKKVDVPHRQGQDIDGNKIPGGVEPVEPAPKYKGPYVY